MSSSSAIAAGVALLAAAGLWWRASNRKPTQPIRPGRAGYALGKRGVTTDKAAQPIAPYTQCVKANGWVYVSGMVGLTKVRSSQAWSDSMHD